MFSSKIISRDLIKQMMAVQISKEATFEDENIH